MRKSQIRGFSLLEVMVVVVIIGLLAGVVTVGVTEFLEKGRRTTAEAQMSEYVKALQFYKMDHGTYPSTGQGLKVLTNNRKGGATPYLANISVDPWGNEYRYRSAASDYEIICFGNDGRSGGTGWAQDFKVTSRGKKR